MKNCLKRFMLLTLCSCVLIWVITGCNISSNSESKNKEATIAVACLIAHASNQKRVDMDSLIYDTVNECTTNFGYLFGIRLDGQPKTVFADNLDIDERFKTASKERLALDVQKKASEELEKLNKIKAVQPEIDFLEGLREGSTALRSLSKNISEKAIICTGSGLQTTGILDFRNNILCASPNVIVEDLKTQDALPNLQGITVYWQGLGEVEAPQTELSPKQTKALTEIWKAIIEASGGKFENISEVNYDKSAEDSIGQLPLVSVVDINAEPPITYSEQSSVINTESDGKIEPISLDEAHVGFIADTAEYSQSDIAVASIEPIAEYLKSVDTKILLVGTTAGDENTEKGVALSFERANRVKQTFEELGIGSERIETLGLGCTDPWHVKNAGYSGFAAQQNRKVVVLDASTEQAQEIMENVTVSISS